MTQLEQTSAGFSPAVFLFLVREEFADALVDELRCRLALRNVHVAPDALTIEPGLVKAYLSPEAAALMADLPLVFERQRLANAILLEGESLKVLGRAGLVNVLPTVSRSKAFWTCHCFAPDSDQLRGSSGRARSLEQVFLDLCRERFSAVWRRYRPVLEESGGLVLQLCVTGTQVWGCVMDEAALPDRRAGGIHRMAFDDRAPSRSYLKLEEAFHVMKREPSAGATVVDLGAAPGGWTFACLKRGCRVTAVDNGPLHIPLPEHPEARLNHLKVDGIVFEPREPSVDWLVSDMLMGSGKNIGMMRKWFDNRWMKNFVINIKLPQQQPYSALPPVEEFLSAVPGLHWSLRHLYHDRREVTLMGWFE